MVGADELGNALLRVGRVAQIATRRKLPFGGAVNCGMLKHFDYESALSTVLERATLELQVFVFSKVDVHEIGGDRFRTSGIDDSVETEIVQVSDVDKEGKEAERGTAEDGVDWEAFAKPRPQKRVRLHHRHAPNLEDVSETVADLLGSACIDFKAGVEFLLGEDECDTDESEDSEMELLGAEEQEERGGEAPVAGDIPAASDGPEVCPANCIATLCSVASLAEVYRRLPSFILPQAGVLCRSIKSRLGSWHEFGG